MGRLSKAIASDGRIQSGMVTAAARGAAARGDSCGSGGTPETEGVEDGGEALVDGVFGFSSRREEIEENVEDERCGGRKEGEVGGRTVRERRRRGEGAGRLGRGQAGAAVEVTHGARERERESCVAVSVSAR